MTTTDKAIDALARAIDEKPARSAWARGVKTYALELLENVQDWDGGENFRRKEMLNGAQDWRQYSEGGCALIYDGDIAERLCTPSELKRTRDGERNPNGRETWIDCQARALFQACQLILRTARKQANRA